MERASVIDASKTIEALRASDKPSARIALPYMEKLDGTVEQAQRVQDCLRSLIDSTQEGIEKDGEYCPELDEFLSLPVPMVSATTLISAWEWTERKIGQYILEEIT